MLEKFKTVKKLIHLLFANTSLNIFATDNKQYSLSLTILNLTLINIFNSPLDLSRRDKLKIWSREGVCNVPLQDEVVPVKWLNKDGKFSLEHLSIGSCYRCSYGRNFQIRLPQ